MSLVTPADVAWVMRTLDRSRRDPPRQNYLRGTLTALVDSGFDLSALHVVDSLPPSGGEDVPPWWVPALPTPDCRLTVHPTDRPLTNNQNALRALTIGLDTGCPWIVHLEDDLAVCADFAGSVTRWLTDHTQAADPVYPLYTFHAPYAQVRRAVEVGQTSWAYPIRNFYGNQCWAVRREAAQSIVALVTPRAATWTSGQGFDLLLKDWAPQYQPGAVCFLASAPSFVQHTGTESSLHLGRFHQNQSWPGAHWRYPCREASHVPR